MNSLNNWPLLGRCSCASAGVTGDTTEIKVHCNYAEGQVVWSVVREDRGSPKRADSTSGGLRVRHKPPSQSRKVADWSGRSGQRSDPLRGEDKVNSRPYLSPAPSFLPFRFLLGLFVFILHDFIISAVKINSHFSFSLNAQLCHLKMKSTPFPLLLRAHTHVLYTSPGCFYENQ